MADQNRAAHAGAPVEERMRAVIAALGAERAQRGTRQDTDSALVYLNAAIQQLGRDLTVAESEGEAWREAAHAAQRERCERLEAERARDRAEWDQRSREGREQVRRLVEANEQLRAGVNAEARREAEALRGTLRAVLTNVQAAREACGGGSGLLPQCLANAEMAITAALAGGSTEAP